MIIDGHQHFWKYDPVRDSWIDDSMQVIRRNFLPEDVLPHYQTNNIDGCIAVQADQSLEETDFLLGLAKTYSFIKGVVGWVDLCDNAVEESLAHYSSFNAFKGVRHILQAEHQDFMLSASFLNGIGKLEKYGLTYDILVFPNQLQAAKKLVKKFPNQCFVLDHLGKPYIKEGRILNWKKDLQELAQLPNVSCKVSGLVTEANWEKWSPDVFEPYLDVVFEAFGCDRLLFGSDWPVSNLAANFNEVLSIVKNYTATLTENERSKIMANNAIKFYKL